ncbi:MAG: sulfurtransferase [Candidatus Eremiobacteraeota bacterium]|nr:sulfurtransferase [Candidatus Eremiobacteraeota bacterium]
MLRTIVSPQELARHLDDRAWLVLDCRHSLQNAAAGRAAYASAHIPGAFFAGLEEDLAGAKTGKNGRHPLPDAHEFAAFLAAYGANDDTQIVAYDAGGDMFASRLWFLLKWIGHDAVAVLDGGFAAWQAGGYPTTDRPSLPPSRGTLVPRVRDELTVDAREVIANLPSQQFMVLDARSADRFEGRNETIDPIGGHIPNASNRWFKENYDASGRFKTPDALRAEFDALGVASQRIVHQCGSGISATVNALAMEHAELHGSRLYPGSWSEWCADPNNPTA